VLGLLCLAMAISGPGRASLDHWIGIDGLTAGWLGLVVAAVVAFGGAGVLLAATWRPPAANAAD
jgi:putative oxidoreductase